MNDAADRSELIEQLSRASESISRMSGLGRGITNKSERAKIYHKLVRNGQLDQFAEAQSLELHSDLRALREALLDRVERAGTPVRSPLEKAQSWIKEALRKAPERREEYLPGEQTPTGPGVVSLTAPRIRYLDRETAREQRWKVLEGNDAALNGAISDLKALIEELPHVALSSGHALAFRASKFGIELLNPKDQSFALRTAEERRYLVTADTAVVQILQQSGAHDRKIADRVERAIAALTWLYETLPPEKMVVQGDALPVFQDLFELSGDAFTKTVWKDTQIGRWRPGGRRAEAHRVSPEEIQRLLSQWLAENPK